MRSPLQLQRSFDDLGTPLSEATFVVVDLETTGAAPGASGITEIGAAKYRGGELLGTFATLVDPGMAIPPFITVLTGITEAMVCAAPPVEEVLPPFLEFLGDAVIVGHNVRFDISFLDAALAAAGRERLANRRADTLALARRLLRDEVPDLRLGTLAASLRLPHRPSHRALDDVLATADLFHALLERAGTLGVLAVDDLLDLPTIKGHPQLNKLRLTANLPRRPGVYLFRDAGGRVLYVGKATDLRSRVRSYFTGDGRRKVPQLLREAMAIDHVECESPLEAEVLELRLIRAHEPRFNRRSKGWRRYAYLELTLNERFPRLAVVRAPRPGNLTFGPLHSSSAAAMVKEAVETVAPVRRCSKRVPARARPPATGPCVAAQLGLALCPCSGDVDETAYAEVVDRVRTGLTTDPGVLVAPLEARMRELAAAERFEEAAGVRDRLAALLAMLRRQRHLDAMRSAGRLVLDAGGRDLEVVGGLLALAHGPAGIAALPLPGDPAAPARREEVDEILAVARWLEREARRGAVRLVSAEGELAWPLRPEHDPVRAASALR